MTRLEIWLLMALAFGIAVAILGGRRNRQDQLVAVGIAVVGVVVLAVMAAQGL